MNSLHLGAKCPACKSDDWTVDVSGTEICENRYEIVHCPNCGAELELEITVKVIYVKHQSPEQAQEEQ